jgi:hypothetical protein
MQTQIGEKLLSHAPPWELQMQSQLGGDPAHAPPLSSAGSVPSSQMQAGPFGTECGR